MKNILRLAVIALLAAPVLTACEKEGEDNELEGAVPEVSFTTTSKMVGFFTEVTFTATGGDASFYSWDFGDGTTGSGKTVTHLYKSGGVKKAQLITSSRGGQSFSQVQDITIVSSLDVIKRLLTGATSKTWQLDNSQAKAITVGTENNSSEYYGGGAANSLPECQTDDEYTFSAANQFTYNAKAETFVAGAFTCQAPRSGTSEFTFAPATGAGLAMFEFKKAGTFIGVTDAPDLTYRILEISETNMVIRAGKPSGTVFDMKLVAKK